VMPPKNIGGALSSIQIRSAISLDGASATLHYLDMATLAIQSRL